MKTPIVDFVKKYAASNSIRLHMPGHKGVGSLGFEKIDITEIEGADVLYSADGIIAESQQNASKLFKSKKTLYSTEGSSLCIRAMLYLIKYIALQNGEKPLIAAGRNAHKTFVSTCGLLDIDVEWLLPINSNSIISCDITADYIKEYLSGGNPKPSAVYITTPDYLGNTVDIEQISRVCREHNVLVVVDNAHGAYLKFLAIDKHPITLGADMCCDSAHKTLPVLTGGAYLHVSDTAPDFLAENAQTAMSIFASTSPSYIILQSLDEANKYIYDNYKLKLSAFVKKVDAIKNELALNGYSLCGNEPLKITIYAKSYGYTGIELSQILAQKNIVCEFCDPDYIVFMLSPENEEDIEKLKNALLDIKSKEKIKSLAPLPGLKQRKNTFAQVLYAKKEKLPIEKCKGKISGCIDAICPPAIPIILPGEEIDDDAIKSLKYYGIKEWIVLK